MHLFWPKMMRNKWEGGGVLHHTSILDHMMDPRGMSRPPWATTSIVNAPIPAHVCQQLGINASFWPKMMRNEWGGGGFSHPTIAAINNCFSLTREED